MPTVLNGHEGHSISSIEFKKSYKASDKSSKTTSSKAKPKNLAQGSKSVSGTSKNGDKSMDRSSQRSRDSKENKYKSKEGGKPEERGSKQIETFSQRNYSSENVVEENKHEERKYRGSENPVNKRPKVAMPPNNKPNLIEYKSQHSDTHLSDYGEPVSYHSSVLDSSSSKERMQLDIPPIVKVKSRDRDDERQAQQDVVMLDESSHNDNFKEIDDFTDQQKEYIQKLLDNKLDDQKERLMGYFQNMQIEMIRQFQIQYLELSQVIDDVLDSKNRNKFVNNLNTKEDSD